MQSRVKYDVFISYAHVNDKPLPPAIKVLVTTFVVGLKSKLAEEIGRKEDCRLWMDYDLRGNDSVTPKIHEILDKAGTLVLCLSKGYLASRWCREELTSFLDRVGTDSGRVFVVYHSPVEKMPESLTDLKKYEFWLEDEKGQPRTLAVPIPDPTERTYYNMQENLARDLARKIRDLRPAVRQGAVKEVATGLTNAVPVPPSGRVVFVCAGDDDLDLTPKIANRLQTKGFSFILALAALPGFDPDRMRVAELRHERDRNLKDCDEVLMLYRAGPVNQLREQIFAWRRSAARRKGEVPKLNLFQENPDPMAVGVSYPGMQVRVMPELRAEECVRAFSEAVTA